MTIKTLELIHELLISIYEEMKERRDEAEEKLREAKNDEEVNEQCVRALGDEFVLAQNKFYEAAKALEDFATHSFK